ncbi:hypothetical protein GGH19_001928 [Coemansia sp. RSA 1807]|nr:hypothetical protein GGH19_001928 [Coemansia sp. RSA 1807]
MHFREILAPALAVLAVNMHSVLGSPAPVPDASQVEAGKQLWISTPESTAPPAGISLDYALHPARRAQPPTGVHLSEPKDRPAMNEQDRQAGFIRKSDVGSAAPVYRKQAPVIKGITSVLDSNQQSPLNGGNPLAFKSQKHPYVPNASLFDSSTIKLPLATNKWWQNLIVEKGVDPIHPYPYIVYCNTNSTKIGFPKFTIAPEHVTSDMSSEWELGDASGALTQRKVTNTDALGVEVTWSGSGSAQMRSRFYKGMPFQTFELKGVTPILRTTNAIIKVEPVQRAVLSARNTEAQVTTDAADIPAMSKITLNDNSQWLVASKPEIKWKQNEGTLTQQGAYTGFVQLAHLGDQPQNNINVLQQYVGTYPIEGTVTYAQVQGSDSTGRSSNIVYVYKTNTDVDGDTKQVYNTTSASTTMQLLSFVLPHHVDKISNNTILSTGLSGYRSAKGRLTAVAGNTISYNQPLERVSFGGMRAIGDSDKERLKQQLLKDAASSTTVTAQDPYFYGKGVARVARLYQIAQEVGDKTTAAALGTKIVNLLTPWLVSMSNNDTLVYDATWGGIVSTLGISDPSQDFGQGRYNDHHFHYGYFLYAGAILAKYDINTFAPLREPMNQLLRDYANPSYADTQFPYMRHFDPYDGHSWAAGLFSFMDGRNQESTGEAINAYYSAYLYATALGFEDTAAFYEIVLNMEAASGRRYWHPMRSQSKDLYGDAFSHNTVGIVWSSKVDYVTFFGADTEFVYGIQMLPFTPATRMLIRPDWVKEAWCPDNSTCADGMKTAAQHANKNGWAQFLYSAYAMVDRNAALDNALACTPDDGNTLTNTMHWIFTNQQASANA